MHVPGLIAANTLIHVIPKKNKGLSLNSSIKTPISHFFSLFQFPTFFLTEYSVSLANTSNYESKMGCKWQFMLTLTGKHRTFMHNGICFYLGDTSAWFKRIR